MSISEQKLNNQLLTFITLSDIIIYKKINFRKINYNYYYSNSVHISRNTYALLNLLSFLQSIKQFVRVVQFQSSNYFGSDFTAQIITKNVLYRHLIKVLTDEKKFLVLLGVTKYNTKFLSKLVLFSDYLMSNKKMFTSLVRCFYNNIFFIVFINLLHATLGKGSFKIFAALDTYKKFLIPLLIMCLVHTKK